MAFPAILLPFSLLPSTHFLEKNAASRAYKLISVILLSCRIQDKPIYRRQAEPPFLCPILWDTVRQQKTLGSAVSR